MADRLTLAPPTGPDIVALDADMRAADRDEIVAAAGADVLRTLYYSVELSHNVLAVRAPEGLLCIFGTAALSLTSDEGSPWMLGTTLLDAYPRTLARIARRYIGEMVRVFPVLSNHVDVRNSASLKLLAWLGFSFDEPAPYGVAGLPFRRFEMRRV